MRPERILILAGTREARDLANALVEQGRDVVSSFAGVTTAPLLPKGKIRDGGFGGVDGLVAYLQAEKITCVVDATHPFAAQMSVNVCAAAQILQLPLLRLERAAWQEQPEDNWTHAASLAEAASRVPKHARVMVTTGRKSLEYFYARPDLSGLIRTIEPPDQPPPKHWNLLQDRPPYTVQSERNIMKRESITCLVTKNAGGSATEAKLTAARELGLPVVMIARPTKPKCDTVETVQQALLGIADMTG